MVVTTSGVLCQQLKLDENFQERRTAFLGFQLLPEVPRAPAARPPAIPPLAPPPALPGPPEAPRSVCRPPHRDSCLSRGSCGRCVPDTTTSTSGPWGTWAGPLSGSACKTAPRSDA